MKIPTIETSRMILRPWILEDVDELHQILEEQDILKYFPPTTFTFEKTRNYIHHQVKHWQGRGYGHWAVILKEKGRVAGWAGLEYLPETDENEVAYLLSHQVWGCGYATEAAQASLKYGFKIAGLTSVIGLVHPDNIGSIRVLQKCGLKFVDRKVYWGLEMLRYRMENRKGLTLLS